MKNIKGKSLCLFSAKGGVGKTTNILNLAGIFEQLEKRVLVIDMDLYSGGIAAYLNKKGDKSIYHMIFDISNGTYKNIDDYNNERLNTAYRDIKQKLALKNRNTNYWDTAKSNIVKFHFSDVNERKQIVNILTEDRNKEILNNAIIVSVVFDDSDLELNLEKIIEKYNSLKVEKENITIVCIRKRTIDNIIKIFYDIRNGQNEL